MLVLLAIGIILIAMIVVFVPDYDSPLNFVMFRSPGMNRYSSQLVNMWVDKNWRNDNKKIPCRIEYGNEEKPARERNIILYSHGNAEDLLSCVQFIREVATHFHMDVITWDYSGYGLNETDRFERSPEGVNLSIQSVFQHLTDKLGYKEENVILWGYSLGSGPSIHLASQRKNVLGLVLFGAYSSVTDVVKDHTHANVASLFTERWNSKATIAFVTCPILIMHGQSDGLIKPHHAESLQKANPTNSKLILLPTVGHTCFTWSDAMKEVRTWMTEKQLLQ